ncbi:MAG: hypothetical protein J0M34_08575 [Alphaproteobacteria bacterium]|nr:hypothetical protein [Alphaproteobacteria bacterium]
MSHATTTPPNGINPTTIDAHVAGTSDARRGFDWSRIFELFQAFFERLAGRSDDDRTPDRDRDAAPPTTQPDGTPTPVATITGLPLTTPENVSFTNLDADQEAAARDMLIRLADRELSEDDKTFIRTTLAAHPELANIQVDLNHSMLNWPAMSIDQFIERSIPMRGKIVADREDRDWIRASLDEARRTPSESPTPVTDVTLVADRPNPLETYFASLENRIVDGETVRFRAMLEAANAVSDTPYTEAQLDTAERNITAAFDRDENGLISTTELAQMRSSIAEQPGIDNVGQPGIDTTGELLGHFSAPTFNIAAAREQNASLGVSV